MIILKWHNKGGHSREVLHGALWWLFEETLKLITGPLKTRHKKGQEQGYYYFIINKVRKEKHFIKISTIS